jgi:cell division septation protein DedD
VSDHQAAFTEMLRVGREMRKRMFDTLEQRHADDLGSGKKGVKLYEDLLSAVRDAGVPEAAEEFENRFLPLVKQGQLRAGADFDPPDEMTNPNQDRRTWDWISALCVAAVIVGALILGLNALKMTIAEAPTVSEPPVPAAKATEEPASETMTQPAPTTAPEQDPSSEH